MINNSFLLICLLLFAFMLSVALEMIALPRIIYIAKKKSLYDVPNARKAHKKMVPRLAGSSFFPILVFVFCVCALLFLQKNQLGSLSMYGPALRKLFGVIGGNMLLLGVGLKDDLVGSRYRHKMIVQFMAGLLLVSGGLYINDFNGLFGLGIIPIWVGVPLTVLLVMFITNAINLIDGADGLASGISGIALIAFGILFYFRGMFFYSLISVILVGILVPFFYYNVFKVSRKVFMGDAGSLTLGFQLAYLGVRFAMDVPPDYGYFKAPVMIALSILFIPMFDALRVMVDRAFARQSMFLPDRRHIHHKLLDLGFSHRKVMLSLVMCAGFLILLNVLLLQLININWMFVIDIFFWFTFVQLLNVLLWRKKTIRSISKR